MERTPRIIMLVFLPNNNLITEVIVDACYVLCIHIHGIFCRETTKYTVMYGVYIVLANPIFKRCIYGIFCREITIHTVIYGVYIRFWPTLPMYVGDTSVRMFLTSPMTHQSVVVRARRPGELRERWHGGGRCLGCRCLSSERLAMLRFGFRAAGTCHAHTQDRIAAAAAGLG